MATPLPAAAPSTCVVSQRAVSQAGSGAAHAGAERGEGQSPDVLFTHGLEDALSAGSQERQPPSLRAWEETSPSLQTTLGVVEGDDGAH